MNGYPANNVLLYGDRGTGKSSTVHAILNEYREKGLRMIEISKSDIGDLTMIREKIADSPMKFIIFIDDLSFDSHEDSFGELKAALEGSLSGKQSNTGTGVGDWGYIYILKRITGSVYGRGIYSIHTPYVITSSK